MAVTGLSLNWHRLKSWPVHVEFVVDKRDINFSRKFCLHVVAMAVTYLSDDETVG